MSTALEHVIVTGGTVVFSNLRDRVESRVEGMNANFTMSADRKIRIELEPAAREWLADKGWDPAYGARPLKRVIQKSVQDPLWV